MEGLLALEPSQASDWLQSALRRRLQYHVLETRCYPSVGPATTQAKTAQASIGSARNQAFLTCGLANLLTTGLRSGRPATEKRTGEIQKIAIVGVPKSDFFECGDGAGEKLIGPS